MWKLRSRPPTWWTWPWTTSSRAFSCSQGRSGRAARWWAEREPRRPASGHSLALKTHFYALPGHKWINMLFTPHFRVGNSATVSLLGAMYLQEFHWGRGGWETGESILSRPGRSRCRFWSDYGLSDWHRRSSPSEAVSPSSPRVLSPDRCSTGSASSGQTHWCGGRSTEPLCRRHRPEAVRQRRTCKHNVQSEHYDSNINGAGTDMLWPLIKCCWLVSAVWADLHTNKLFLTIVYYLFYYSLLLIAI